MLSECKKKEYYDCVNSKGKAFAAESLFLILILEQQKMINEMIASRRIVYQNTIQTCRHLQGDG
jgi:hypothetical protein